MINPQLLSGADLAFLGDAYYELIIRNYLLHKGITNLHRLHDECVKYVSRTAQHKISKQLFPELTDEEKTIFKRGRNYNYKVKAEDYLNASGFEAVVGYLYLKDNKLRLQQLIEKAIKIIEENINE